MARKDRPDIRRLAFKYVRKTAGDMVRAVSDGEVAGVFLAHGQPVRSDSLADVYTNRPFVKVFKALDGVADRLRTMFAASVDPFPPYRRPL